MKNRIRNGSLAAVLLLVVLVTGCNGGPSGSPYAYTGVGAAGQTAPQPGAPGFANTPISAPPPGTAPANIISPMLRVGDLVIINWFDLPPPGIPEYRENIRDDGELNLPLNVQVMAAGKTVGQLQEDIRKAYVPRYFNRLTVSVKTEERFYFVGGEVKVPNRQPYIGDMTVLRAIDTAGGFTDFANRNNIELRRANGEHFVINWKKAMKNHRLDLPVYPNDQIIVHQRRL